MAYSATSGDPANMGFILGRLLDMISQIVTNRESSELDLDQEALLVFEYASFYTWEDPQFKVEWESVQADRAKQYREHGLKAGDDGALDLSFRFRELGCNVRSLCRRNVLTRGETNSTVYVPAKKGAKPA